MELPRIMQTTTFLCSCTLCDIMGRTGRSRGRASPHPANDRHRVQRPQPKPTHTDASSSYGAQTATATLPHKRNQPTRPQRPPATTPTNAHQKQKSAVATPTNPQNHAAPPPTNPTPEAKSAPEQFTLLPECLVSHRPTLLQSRWPEHMHYCKNLYAHRFFLPIANGAQRLS